MKNLKGRTHRKRRKRKLDQTIDSTDSFLLLNFSLLTQWMGMKNFKTSKSLKPKYFKDTGRGLMTKQSIKSGDLVLAIPENLLITIDFVLKSEIGPFFEKFCPKATGQQILSVFLMFQKSLGASSEWSPYISSLPETYSIPAFYGLSCMNVIPQLMYEQSLKQIKTVEESYIELLPLLKSMKEEMPLLHGLLSKDLYKWAWCSVNTRCVYMECSKNDCVGKLCSFHLALAPFLDLLNHSSEVQVQAGYNKKRKQYEIISLYDLQKYSQVFISYGCHDNLTLFLEYGFVVPNNINDTISFTKDNILYSYQQCNFTSEDLYYKLKFLSEKELLRNLVCSSDGLSWNLVMVLRILSSNHDLKWWKTMLCSNTVFTTEDLYNFKKLQKMIISLKRKEMQIVKTQSECSFEDDYFLKNVSQLLLMTDELLIKALKS